MKTIIITGGTGLIGTALTHLLLEKKYKVIVFTRQKGAQSTLINCTYAFWDPDAMIYDSESIEKADAIINLAGAGIADKRWTKKRMQEIRDSRMNSNNTIVKALAEVDNRVSVVVNASAIGYYGISDGIKIHKEDELPGKGFLSEVCNDWEQKIKIAGSLEKRIVILRTGVVLSRKGGAYNKMTMSLKFRVGALPGSGNEIMSWIHISDLCNMFLYAIENTSLSGTYNAGAPYPVTTKVFMKSVGKQRFGAGFITIPTPLFLLRTALGKVVDEALLQNAKVSCEKILETGFSFQFKTIEEAVADLEKKKR